MFESLPGDKDSSPRQSTAEQDIKIEQLLLSGLDHYFKAHYERAIDVWTRVLFLDRAHARARAYIERARAALAECLRESEELLHTGVEAFNRGEIDKARNLFISVVEGGGGRDEALGFLERLDRLERASGHEMEFRGEVDAVTIRSSSKDKALPVEQKPVRILPLVLLIVLLFTSGYVALSWRLWSPLVVGNPMQLISGPAINSNGSLPVPSVAAATLVRARLLVREGNHQTALKLLETIGTGDLLAGDADVLRTSIQKELLFFAPKQPLDSSQSGGSLK
jgi:hypothetical protein